MKTAKPIQFAVVRISNNEPVQTLAIRPSIKQAKIVIHNRRFLDDWSDLKIYKGTSALDWEEVIS